MSRFAGTALLLAVLLAGCSHNQSIDPEELKSAATELTSIAAEAELFANFVAQGHATNAYAKGHPEYLRQQSKDLHQEFERKNVPPDIQNAFSTLQQLSQQLDQTLNAVPVDPHDSRWPELAADFARITHAARVLGRSL